jgi:hypothetical protein
MYAGHFMHIARIAIRAPGSQSVLFTIPADKRASCSKSDDFFHSARRIMAKQPDSGGAPRYSVSPDPKRTSFELSGNFPAFSTARTKALLPPAPGTGAKASGAKAPAYKTERAFIVPSISTFAEKAYDPMRRH